MAARAIPLCDGAMQRFSGELGLFVADEAKLLPVALEHILEVCLMGIVTTHALAFGYWGMWILAIVLCLFMAHVTELLKWRLEL